MGKSVIKYYVCSDCGCVQERNNGCISHFSDILNARASHVDTYTGTIPVDKCMTSAKALREAITVDTVKKADQMQVHMAIKGARALTKRRSQLEGCELKNGII